MEQYLFTVNIPPAECERYYRGQASRVLVVDSQGRRLLLPAVNFRPFVTATGIQGRFRVQVDARNRLVRLERVGAP